ncbi:hypothetical protein CA596_14985 [Paenibacillus odorifer]|nr:hypothetical protein CA596_14985 [Paenibacillus odorifer]
MRSWSRTALAVKAPQANPPGEPKKGRSFSHMIPFVSTTVPICTRLYFAGVQRAAALGVPLRKGDLGGWPPRNNKISVIPPPKGRDDARDTTLILRMSTSLRGVYSAQSQSCA